MRTSLTATTALLALSATALSGAQGSVASAQNGSGSPPVARARHAKVAPKPAKKAHRRPKRTRCSVDNRKPKRAGHTSKRRGVTKTKTLKCTHRPGKKPKQSPARVGLGPTPAPQVVASPTLALAGSPLASPETLTDCANNPLACDFGFTGSSGIEKSTAAGELGPNLSAKECFENPEEGTAKIEACGYPGMHNEGPNGKGVGECEHLTEVVGNKTLGENAKVENESIIGEVTVTGDNVTLNNDCISVNGGYEGYAIKVEGELKGPTISNSVIRGKNTTNESIEEAVALDHSNSGFANRYTVRHSIVYHCGECLRQNEEVTDSFVDANGEMNKVEEPNATGKAASHKEAFFIWGQTAVLKRDTMFNPSSQTAVIEGGASPASNITLEESFLAGGGYVLNANNAPGEQYIAKNNRFARCLGKLERQYGYICDGGEESNGNSIPDGHGFWPTGGYYSLSDGWSGLSNYIWSGNFYDDNLELCNGATAEREPGVFPPACYGAPAEKTEL